MKHDEHIMEAVGKTRVRVKNGIVVEVGEPLIHECPLAKKFSQPVLIIDKGSVQANVEERIRQAGMFTKNRVLLSKEECVPFGASELLATGLRSGLIDAAVIASDGAGTVVTINPDLVQGIGGRMSGLVKTSPIKEVIDGIEAYGGQVLDPSCATIDQVRGAVLARNLGHSCIAVTVASASDAQNVRQADHNALIIGVHTTGVSKKDAKQLAQYTDLLFCCASKWIREVAGKVALLQAGTSVPAFALTKKGKALIAEMVKETQQPLLIKVERLPAKGENEPDLV